MANKDRYMGVINIYRTAILGFLVLAFAPGCEDDDSESASNEVAALTADSTPDVTHDDTHDAPMTTEPSISPYLGHWSLPASATLNGTNYTITGYPEYIDIFGGANTQDGGFVVSVQFTADSVPPGIHHGVQGLCQPLWDVSSLTLAGTLMLTPPFVDPDHAIKLPFTIQFLNTSNSTFSIPSYSGGFTFNTTKD